MINNLVTKIDEVTFETINEDGMVIFEITKHNEKKKNEFISIALTGDEAILLCNILRTMAQEADCE